MVEGVSHDAALEQRNAFIAGVLCYVIWGFIPLAFQAMAHAGAGSVEIVAHRATWSVVWASLLVLVSGHWAQVRWALGSPQVMGWVGLATAMTLVNGVTYVIAVNGGRALDASLAYYLSPMLNMAVGAWLFRERISRVGAIAIALAGIGVALQAVALGHLPWVSLLMGTSFCAYGVIRKRLAVDAQAGLLLESMLVAPLGLAWVIWSAFHGQGHFGDGPGVTLWLLAAAPLTVAPTAMFAWAARRMPFSTLGFLQFIAPTIVFVIGVSQGEAFGWLRALSFGFIWAGAAVYAAGATLSRQSASSSSPQKAASAAPPPEIMP